MKKLIFICLFLISCSSTPVKAEPVFSMDNLNILIEASPETTQVHFKTIMSFSGVESGKKYTFAFAKPKKMEKVENQLTGEQIEYEIVPYPNVPPTVGLSLFSFTAPTKSESLTLKLEYLHNGKTFFGYAQNPSTLDNLVFGQITETSIFSSHLYYYPFSEVASQKATIRISVPEGWTGISSGKLTSESNQNGKKVFEFDIPHSSGRLPYPFAIFPYQQLKQTYQDRLPITIFHHPDDAKYAVEKMEIIESKILPFLENLMGPYPFESIKIVELFPVEGNTGLAAKSVVMLSQKVWFAERIGGNYQSEAAAVLVDELAHQWNFYKVRLPNFLAEGASEYTDNLFLESVLGPEILEKKVTDYEGTYLRIAKLLNLLKGCNESGLDISKCAESLEMEVTQIQPYWGHAQYGERPITDPHVFNALYFIKGMLALHALRSLIGKDLFFKGFKSLFSTSSNNDLDLQTVRKHFESISGKNLEAFFQKWFFETGLPSQDK